MKTYAEHASNRDGNTFDVWIRAAVNIGVSTLFGITTHKIFLNTSFSGNAKIEIAKSLDAVKKFFNLSLYFFVSFFLAACFDFLCRRYCIDVKGVL